MEAIILDSSSLIRYPKLLAAASNKFKFATTSEVLAELGKTGENYTDINSNYNGLLDLINTAIAQKTLEVNTIEYSDRDYFAQDIHKRYGISRGDKSLIVLGSVLKGKYTKVYLATQDKVLEKFAEGFGLELLGSKKVEEIIQNSTGENKIVEDQANQYEKTNSNKFFIGIIIGCLVTVFVFTIYFNFRQIVQSINIWGTIVLSILLGIGLFVFREKQRFSYGVFEFLSGISTIILIFYPKFNFSDLTYNFDFYAKLLGGLYIMVRGQDNIVKSLYGKKAGLWLKEKTGIG